MAVVDEEFGAQALDDLADAALGAAREAGAQWCDVRVSWDVSRHCTLRDGALEDSGRDENLGMGIRVLVDGRWGFAGTWVLDSAAAADTARRAVRQAQTPFAVKGPAVHLASLPPVHGEWVADYALDPTTVPDIDVIDRLRHWHGLLEAEVDHTELRFDAAKERTYYADSSGSRTIQQRVRCHPTVSATILTESGFDDMSCTRPPTGRGWEYAMEDDWDDDVRELSRNLEERSRAGSAPPGRYDLVIAPSNLWLTIHESVGHATEYDRAIGLESNYAGTSFATPDQLGTLRYGSALMNVVADRTQRHGLATVAWDHEGVAAGEWPLVDRGVLVGYQLDRAGAADLGVLPNGCAYADGPEHVPMQRMPNVSLQPTAGGGTLASLISGVSDGLLVVGDKSWSIDQRRRNFQFTAQRFHRIRAGVVAEQVKDIAYQSDTLDFWRSLAAVGGPKTYELHGALNCGKGQPGQVAAVGHGAPAAVFENVRVLATGGGM